MKTNTLSKIASSALAVLFLTGLTGTATAGPGPMMFHPVKTEKEASELKVGSQIAVNCGKCHGTAVMSVDRERSYLHGYTCPMCKLAFKTIMPGGGGRGTYGLYYYTDGAGHNAGLAARN